MARKHGPWTVINSARKFKGSLIELWLDAVIKPDGEPGEYVTIRVQPGVSVIALDDESCLHLAREFRYAVGRECLEAVGGAVDEGEEPVDAARRELREELGIEAEELIPLGHVEPMTSIAVASSHLFLARRLRFTEPQQEGSEQIECVRLPLDEAVKLVMAGKITEAASCALILKAANFVSGQ